MRSLQPISYLPPIFCPFMFVPFFYPPGLSAFLRRLTHKRTVPGNPIPLSPFPGARGPVFKELGLSCSPLRLITNALSVLCRHPICPHRSSPYNAHPSAITINLQFLVSHPHKVSHPLSISPWLFISVIHKHKYSFHGWISGRDGGKVARTCGALGCGGRFIEEWCARGLSGRR